ncbi:DUF6268 family outer membrane beta-barrel protein [Aquimarina sp. 2201CG14-23]|uniref:DUF6268 family outer membrane beta-barrel protein n=1 Tax=Aquimarina mycalae TaxID=3040073 RepID=UPI0024781B3B|nr:DUF6268 family outer membrane beta-barrel protein [Aquimarina sp. 2201CG14-23]MDH7444465.1 DUF6268 family outer membrane beta-barrel protein [Aquimarina sp. 2201CG14-23]
MKQKSLFLFCIFIFCSIATIKSQDTNLARIEYAYIPQSKSDNVYSRFRVLGNYPIKINEKGTYLVMTFQYRLNSLQLKDDMIFENKKGLEEFHTIGFELGYTFKMKNNWRFGAKLGIRVSSNLEASGIEGDDFRYTGSLYFVKSYGEKTSPKSARLILGLRYTTPASINFPLPIINYSKKFHPKWSYALGTPKTSIKHFFNEKNTLQAFIGLDRFYGNIQNNRMFIDENGETKVAENASMLIINSALGYEYYFTEHLLFYTYGGYTLSNEIRLRDKNQENVLVINDRNTFYLRGGIKLKL